MSHSLNPQQAAAVHHTQTPLLVLAGAGSGKTRVITQKIAHLILSGQYEPRHICAVTFTNKAAREMKERVGKLLKDHDTTGLHVSTFHTLGLKIIRREYKKLGLRSGFTIYDSQDSNGLIRELLKKEFGGDNDLEDSMRWQISQWKNAYIQPEQALEVASDPKQVIAARLYERYNHFLRTYNAVDFDDLIVLPVQLFQEDEAALGAWREKIRYLLVDEYQDTNTSQYQLVRLLIGIRKGLTAVGDDDQSVYGWRGAQPENLGLLQQDFPDLKVVKLEQNYRSMGNILRAANTLIANNPHQFEKKLWCDFGPGDPIRVLSCKNADHEAERVVSQLLHHRFKHGHDYRDYSILYRGNFQSRPFERMLREHQIPYYLSGGTSFFERTEIKDLMAYLRLLVNPDDDTAFLRAINTPRRGLGPTTIEALGHFAAEKQMSLFSAIFEPELFDRLSSRAANGLMEFARWMTNLNDQAERGNPVATVKELIDDINYINWVEDQSPDPAAAERRVENINELVEWLQKLARKKSEDAKLADLIAQMTLMDILDRNEEENKADAVSLMTMHAAKGLEFDHVFLVGIEEELLPHRNCMDEGNIEEERRLAYVGITRARKSLTLTFAKTRRKYGEVIACEPSRFLDEIPEDQLEWEGQTPVDPEERKERGNAHLAHLRSMLAE